MTLRRISIAAALGVLCLYAALLLSLFWFFDPEVLRATVTSERVLFSVRLSLLAATCATVLALLLAIPAAYGLSRFRFAGKELAETILELPIIVSPAALGAILLIFFNNPLGQWIQDNLLRFVFTFAGVVLAQFVSILGIAVRVLVAAFDEVPVELETVARTLGASPHRAFLDVTLPLARRGLLAALILVWAKALGEFGATLMVAGSMALRTETLPIAVYLRLSTANLEGTVALILVLVSLGLAALFAARRLLRSEARAVG